MKKLMALIIAMSSSISVFAQHPETENLDLNNSKSIRWKDTNGTWRSQISTFGNVFQVTPMGSGVKLFFGDGTTAGDADLWFAKTATTTPSSPLMIIKENGNIGMGGIEIPDEKLVINGNLKLEGNYYKFIQSKSNVYAEQLVAGHGQGGGLMFNASYSGSGNPQANSTFEINGTTYGTRAGYLDFDGNDRRWSFNVSSGTAVDNSTVTWKEIAYWDVNNGIAMSPSGNGKDFFIDTNGNVGIGTETPSAILDVNGSSKFRDRINLTAGSGKGIEYAMDWVTYASASGDKLIFTNENTNGNEIVLQDIDGTVENSELKVLGKIRIGSEVIPNGFRLAVDGAAIMTEVKVEATPWPDYVFTPSYNLQSLSEVESFINENGHLPNIPSASEVEENNGIELGAMNAKLLEKIEELTLHLINKDKQVTNLEQQNAQLEATLTQVLERLEKIESSVEK